MADSPVSVAVEGDTDVPAVRKVLHLAGLTMGPVYGRRGKARLDAQLGGFNNAARHNPW